MSNVGNNGGQNDDSGSSIALATARGRDWPSVRQFNVFVANRLAVCWTWCAALSQRTSVLSLLLWSIPPTAPSSAWS